MNKTVCLTTTISLSYCTGWRLDESRIHDPDTETSTAVACGYPSPAWYEPCSGVHYFQRSNFPIIIDSCLERIALTISVLPCLKYCFVLANCWNAYIGLFVRLVDI